MSRHGFRSVWLDKKKEKATKKDKQWNKTKEVKNVNKHSE